jgi:hypothetical protein
MYEETQQPSNNRPWLFQKGNRANPGGRPKGSKSLKTRAREYLEGLSDEEAIEYFEGLNKIDVWKMAEGMPKQDTEAKVTGDLTITVMKYSDDDSTSL